MASQLLSPEVARQARSQILVPLNGPPHVALTINLWILIALFAIICVEYVIIWALAIHKLWRKEEHFWIAKFVQRSKGNYLLPNGNVWFISAFSIFSVLFEWQLVALIQRRQFDRVPRLGETIAMAVYPTILAMGAWPAIVAQIVGVAFTMEGRYPKIAERFPRPFYVHLWAYGTFAIATGLSIGFGTNMCVKAEPLFEDLSQILAALQAAIEGTLQNEQALKLLQIQARVEQRSAGYQLSFKLWAYTFMGLAAVILFMYLPAAATLLYQLRSSRKALRQHKQLAATWQYTASPWQQQKSDELQTDPCQSQASTRDRLLRLLRAPKANYNPHRYLTVRVALVSTYAVLVVGAAALVISAAAYNVGPGASFALAGQIILGYLHAVFNLIFASATLLQHFITASLGDGGMAQSETVLYPSKGKYAPRRPSVRHFGSNSMASFNISVHKEVAVAVDTHGPDEHAESALACVDVL